MMTLLPAAMLVYTLMEPVPHVVRLRAETMAACVTTAELLQADPRVRSWQCHHEVTRAAENWRRGHGRRSAPATRPE